MGANQQYKSSVFADYLTEAGTNNSRLLEISQATGIVPEGATPKIEVNTLKDVLFMAASMMYLSLWMGSWLF